MYSLVALQKMAAVLLSQQVISSFISELFTLNWSFSCLDEESASPPMPPEIQSPMAFAATCSPNYPITVGDAFDRLVRGPSSRSSVISWRPSTSSVPTTHSWPGWPYHPDDIIFGGEAITGRSAGNFGSDLVNPSADGATRATQIPSQLSDDPPPFWRNRSQQLTTLPRAPVWPPLSPAEASLKLLLFANSSCAYLFTLFAVESMCKRL